MKKSDLVAGTMYAYARGNDTPSPARLLDLRLWKNLGRLSSSDPAAWIDVTGQPGVRQGSTSGWGPSSTTGYLVLRGISWSTRVTAEQLAAIEVPPLPEDSQEAAKVIAALDLPEGIAVEVVVSSRLKDTWENYAQAKAVQDAKKAEQEREDEKKIQEHDAAWHLADERLSALGVQAHRLRLDADWRKREPKVSLTLTELAKLLDLAEGRA